jgi:hypothetical protein
MEVELEERSGNASVLSIDIINYIAEFKDKNYLNYNMHLVFDSGFCTFAWTLAPTLSEYWYKKGTSVGRDLTNPQPGMDVLPHSQLWTKKYCNKHYCKYKLIDTQKKIKDSFYLPESDDVIFDGINTNNNAVFACIYSLGISNAYYDIYGLAQSSKKNKAMDNDISPILRGQGIVCSLMLENSRNRILYSVDEGAQGYKLYIKELYIQGLSRNSRDFKSLSGNFRSIADLTTNKLVTKTVCLGKNTYFAITDKGKLYCLWLDGQNNIKYERQKCSKRFKDLSVNHTIITKNGFYPQIAFITNKGEIYITHLDAYYPPTIFYITTPKQPDKAKRLFYNDGKLLVVYKNKVNKYQDNFELLYGCSLLKRLCSGGIALNVSVTKSVEL